MRGIRVFDGYKTLLGALLMIAAAAGFKLGLLSLADAVWLFGSALGVVAVGLGRKLDKLGEVATDAPVTAPVAEAEGDSA